MIDLKSAPDWLSAVAGDLLEGVNNNTLDASEALTLALVIAVADDDDAAAAHAVVLAEKIAARCEPLAVEIAKMDAARRLGIKPREVN